MGFFGLKRNPRRRSKSRRRNPENHMADELAMFIENDSDLYRQNIQPVIKNLAKKMAKGVYDHTKAVKLWTYSAQWGAQKYTKEIGTFSADGVGSGYKAHGSYGSFSPKDRKDAAEQLADYYLEAVQEAAEQISGKSHKSNPRRKSMARRRKSKSRRRSSTRRSTKRGIRVTFRKGGRHTVTFKRKTATASTLAKRRAAGRRLARMWTKKERMANLKKAWAANRRRGAAKRRSAKRRTVKRRRVARRR